MQETQETWVRSLGQEDALEKEMAIHSSISCLENSMNKGDWQATLHGLAKSKTWLSTHVYMSLHILTPCTSSPTNHTYTHYHIHTTLTHIKMSSSMAGSFQYTGLQINVSERPMNPLFPLLLPRFVSSRSLTLCCTCGHYVFLVNVCLPYQTVSSIRPGPNWFIHL